MIFVDGDAAVTLIHLIPSSFTFSFLFAVFPFLPPSWSQHMRELAGPTEAEPPGVQPAFGDVGNLGISPGSAALCSHPVRDAMGIGKGWLQAAPFSPS